MPLLSRWRISEEAPSASAAVENRPRIPATADSAPRMVVSSSFAVWSAASSVAAIPAFTASTFSVMRLPVSPDCVDSLRTASATTAKPRPASPALAASMARNWISTSGSTPAA